MEPQPVFEVENKTTEPLVLWIEPLGEDYTLLPKDEVAIFPSAEGRGSSGWPSIVVHENGLTVYAYQDYEILCNGQPVESGHQRQPDPRPTIRFEVVLSARPREVYRLLLDAETLSKVFGSPVEKVHNKHKYQETFLAYDKSIEWTIILTKHYSEFFLFWRTSDFPGTAPDSYVKIALEEQGSNTRLLITHTDLPADFQKNWKEFWDKYFFEPMQKYFQTQGSA